VIAAFSPSGYGQQSGLSGEQPTSGNSVTSPTESVTITKCGTVQLPVIRGAPPNEVTVTSLPAVVAAVSNTTSPDRVAILGFAELDVEDVVVGEAVEAPAAGANVRLMLERALESPAGEHPTKSGAVSLTALHSSLLN